jgi:N-acetylglucosaminyl-diphospho-decaprenol L-rhamnosyltransferase
VKPTVYIPHHSGREMLLRTLGSLADPASPHRTVVVDNGSSDGSVEEVERCHPEIEVLALGRNLGFGRALNLATRTVPGDPLIFLNNDVECRPGFVRNLLAALEPGAAMVAGVLLQEDRPELVDSAGVMVESDTLMAFDHLHGEGVETLAGAPDPLGPCGGAALFRRDAFDEVEGFDERIFVYYEDVDLALRLRVAGHACRLADDARALHRQSATLGKRSGRKYSMTGWSRGYLLRRYGVMSRPGSAARALLCEGAICAAQVARDRTFSGVSGRLRGWRDASGLPVEPAPQQGLLDLGVRERLRLRAQRRR